MSWISYVILGVGAFILWKILTIVRSILFRILGLIGAAIAVWRLMLFL